jgi:hypothetical protein
MKPSSGRSGLYWRNSLNKKLKIRLHFSTIAGEYGTIKNMFLLFHGAFFTVLRQ